MSISINEVQTRGIMTKSNLPIGGYSCNPYIGCGHSCKYCYASFMKRFTNHKEPWGTFIDAKYWPKIKNPSKYKGQKIFIGSVTDPYNPLEEKYERTRELLNQLKGSGALITIATKSSLILRDLDLIKSFPNIRISWSINTLDEDFRGDMDKASTIEERLRAMKKFHDEGITTCYFISPIFPKITDVPAIIEKVKNQCNFIWLENLNLRGSYKGDILNYINSKYPQLTSLYKEIYIDKNNSYWEVLDKELRQCAKNHGLNYIVDDDDMDQPFEAPPIVVNYFYHELIRKSSKRRDK